MESPASQALTPRWGLVRSTRWMVFDRTRERVIPQRTGEQFEAPWVRVAPQARNSDRIADQFVEKFGKEIVEVVQISPLGRVQQVQRRIAEHMVAVPVPLFLNENVKVMSLALHGQIPETIFGSPHSTRC